MIATLEQDILNIIKNFKEQVNPDFAPDSQDLADIKKIIQNWRLGRETQDGGDIKYICIDYDGLDRHNVKDFKFSLKDYTEWQSETIEILKSRRKKL